MKYLLNTTLLIGAITLFSAPGALAQEHQHQRADTAHAMPMDHDGMMDMEHMQAMMPQMMQMHARMMADPVISGHMMANAEMQTMMSGMMGSMKDGEHNMAGMMGGKHDMAGMRKRMAEASPDERQAMMQQMHTGMMARMEEMVPEQRQAMMMKMMKQHRAIMADSLVHERMMGDPEMRQMMEQMREGGMMEHGMDDHGKNDHDKGDHR